MRSSVLGSVQPLAVSYIVLESNGSRLYFKNCGKKKLISFLAEKRSSLLGSVQHHAISCAILESRWSRESYSSTRNKDFVLKWINTSCCFTHVWLVNSGKSLAFPVLCRVYVCASASCFTMFNITAPSKSICICEILLHPFGPKPLLCMWSIRINCCKGFLRRISFEKYEKCAAEDESSASFASGYSNATSYAADAIAALPSRSKDGPSKATNIQMEHAWTTWNRNARLCVTRFARCNLGNGRVRRCLPEQACGLQDCCLSVSRTWHWPWESRVGCRHVLRSGDAIFHVGIQFHLAIDGEA